MKTIISLITLFVILRLHSASAQPCTQIPMPLPTCATNIEDQNFFCCGELQGLSGTMIGPAVGDGAPVCPQGGVTNNVSWISFIAGDSTLTITLNLTNCNTVLDVNGNPVSGAQFAIYTECGNVNTAIFCNPSDNTGTQIIPLTGLVPGNMYHLLLDGYAGSQCDYDISIVGETTAPIPQNPTEISGPVIVGAADTPTYSAPLGLNSSQTIWSAVPADIILVDNGDETATVIDWGVSAQDGAMVQICVEGINECYPDTDGISNCINVTVTNNEQIILPTISLCPESPGATVFWELPQIPGSMYEGAPFPGMTYSETLPDPNEPPSSGIMVDYIFTIIAYPIEEILYAENL